MQRRTGGTRMAGAELWGRGRDRTAALLDLFTQKSQKSMETGGRDAFLYCKRGLAGTQTGGEEPSRGHRLVAGTVVSSAFPCPPSPMQGPFSSSPPTKTSMPNAADNSLSVYCVVQFKRVRFLKNQPPLPLGESFTVESSPVQ